MSAASSMEEILQKAKEEERRYEWLKAADYYKQALTTLAESDFLKKGEICENLAYTFYKAAFQADNSYEFKKGIEQAVIHFEEASKIYERSGDTKEAPTILRCSAMIALASHWLASEPAEKKRLLDECWQLTKNSLKVMKGSGKASAYGRTYNQLSRSTIFKFFFDWKFETRKTATMEALEYGEQAIKLLSSLEDSREVATTYVQTASYLGMYGYYFADLDEKESDFQKAKIYWLRAKELDEEAALLELLYPVFGPHIALWGEATEEAFANLEKALEYGKKSRDKFAIGAALDWLTYHTAWTIYSTDDWDVSQKIIEKALQNATDARRYYSVISFISPRADVAWTGTVHGEYIPRYMGETDLGKRRSMLEKAIVALREGFRLAEVSGYPDVILHVHSCLSYQLRQLAGIETNSEERKKLLEEALQHGKEYVRFVKQFRPLEYWDNGIALASLASVEYALSALFGDDSETMRSRLEEAIVDGEKGIRLMIRALAVVGKRSPVLFNELGHRQFSEGVWLSLLYKLSNKEEHLRRSTAFFGDAIVSFERFQRMTRVAECYWNAARNYDALGEYMKAAESFSLASENYNTAASKIPQLKEFYQSYSLYMGAWIEIEKGRHHHVGQNYSLAKQHFEKAADIHRSLKQWSYLSSNYLAWATVEQAEELSRKEETEEAIRNFEKAADLFLQTKKSVQEQLDKIEGTDEKKMATDIIKATGLRQEYCRARIALEEAKSLGKKGDHHLSSEKYRSAANAFETLGQELESEQERKEMKFITILANAWRKMAEAEAEESPKYYAEASRLFETAKDLGQGEKMKELVLGHSRFCMALEAGARFADTRAMAEYASAMQYLESASGYYLKADFQSASDYVKATRLLFDAYVHMGNAAKETDLEKKSRLYIVAEKILQASADSYAKARNQSGKEQALKLLETAREQRELSVSLVEVLQAPIVASTTAFAAPAPTSEKAVGLERFEHAEVNANLILSRKELKVGESLDLEIELANAGTGQALLTQIERAVPEGFELATKPELYRVEGFNINMKGKRLDPLKAEEVRFSLKSKHKGSFTVGPRIVYLDENGNAKSHQPEPVTVTVKELGIKGWIKGES